MLSRWPRRKLLHTNYSFLHWKCLSHNKSPAASWKNELIGKTLHELCLLVHSAVEREKLLKLKLYNWKLNFLSRSAFIWEFLLYVKCYVRALSCLCRASDTPYSFVTRKWDMKLVWHSPLIQFFGSVQSPRRGPLPLHWGCHCCHQISTSPIFGHEKHCTSATCNVGLL